MVAHGMPRVLHPGQVRQWLTQAVSVVFVSAFRVPIPANGSESMAYLSCVVPDLITSDIR